MRTLTQADQQAFLAVTMSSFLVNVCFVCETQTQDWGRVVQLTASNVLSRYFSYTLRDESGAAPPSTAIVFSGKDKAKPRLDPG